MRGIVTLGSREAELVCWKRLLAPAARVSLLGQTVQLAAIATQTRGLVDFVVQEKVVEKFRFVVAGRARLSA